MCVNIVKTMWDIDEKNNGTDKETNINFIVPAMA